MHTIAVLLTCFNRRALTIACLDRLFSQALPPHHAFKVFLVDDGCTDGTAEAVQSRYPTTTILKSDGSLFWCNGMRLAWKHAAEEDPDYYLWLNDDTMLLPGCVETLLRVYRSAGSAASIVIGSCRDAASGEHTYGGVRVPGHHPAKGTLVKPDPETVLNCDTFNGNSVLVSRAAYLRLGNMTSFCHSTGDTDYGLRAKRLGIPLLLAPGYLAECSNNPVSDTWRDITLPRAQRLRMLMGRKGLPPMDYWRFLWTHSGLRALLYWPRPYLRIMLGR